MDEKDFKRLIDASVALEAKFSTLEESVIRLEARMDRLEAMTATQ